MIEIWNQIVLDPLKLMAVIFSVVVVVVILMVARRREFVTQIKPAAKTEVEAKKERAALIYLALFVIALNIPQLVRMLRNPDSDSVILTPSALFLLGLAFVYYKNRKKT